MLLVGAAIVAFVGVLVWQNRPESVSTEPLLGEAMEFGSVSHVTRDAELLIPDGEPPTGGPHFDQPLRTGIYDEPVPDGNAIHSLEHGIVWISYSPDLVTAEDIEALRSIASAHGGDTILSPRPLNAIPVAVVSWGRILRLDRVDEGAIEDFIDVNVNRAPEPNVR